MHADVYDSEGAFIGKKYIFCYDETIGNIGKWVNELRDDDNEMKLGFLSNGRNDFQNQKLVYFINQKSQMPTPRGWWITPTNIQRAYIFIAVRHVIEATWLNDRDQYLYPNAGWKADKEFQCNCLVYTLFSGSNNIQSQYGVNHWIPFTEEEVDAKEKFESHFMNDYLQGKQIPAKISTCEEGELFAQGQSKTVAPEARRLQFSLEAQAVMDAGRELWRYYNQQPDANPNASFYDIRLYFQGTKTTKSGKVQMNTESKDDTYTQLITNLRQQMKLLAEKIEPKVYEYGFLKK